MESDGSVTGERDTDDDETFTDSEQYRSRGTSRSTPSASIASHDGFRIRLLVPTARAGSVLGRGGRIVKSIREETGARVRVCDEMEQAVERVIIVSSRSSSYMSNEAQAQVERAVILVHRAIANPMPDDGSERLHAHAPHASADAVLEQRMLVNQSSTGCLIGHGGEAAKSLQKETGCRLYVQPEEDVPFTYGSTSVDRVVRIVGTRSTLPLAIIATARKLRQNALPHNRSLHATAAPITTPVAVDTTGSALQPPVDGVSMLPHMHFNPHVHNMCTATTPAAPPQPHQQAQPVQAFTPRVPMPTQMPHNNQQAYALPMHPRQAPLMPNAAPSPVPPPPPATSPAGVVPAGTQQAAPVAVPNNASTPPVPSNQAAMKQVSMLRAQMQAQMHISQPKEQMRQQQEVAPVSQNLNECGGGNFPLSSQQQENGEHDIDQSDATG